MPSDSVSAPAIVVMPLPAPRPASITPTAMPSGMLCSVTASIIMADLPRWQLGPSGSSQSMCRCGTNLSSASRNAMPSRKPPAAGANASLPSCALCSIDGMSSDHTEAATITPEAKPSSALLTRSLRLPLSTNTHAAPSAVPRRGSTIPTNVQMFITESPFSLPLSFGAFLPGTGVRAAPLRSAVMGGRPCVPLIKNQSQFQCQYTGGAAFCQSHAELFPAHIFEKRACNFHGVVLY